MTMVTKMRQASLPGRWLVIIRAASIERPPPPPAVGSRGTEAATTLSGAAGECACHSHARKMVAIVGMNVSGPGGTKQETRTISPHVNSTLQKCDSVQVKLTAIQRCRGMHCELGACY